MTGSPLAWLAGTPRKVIVAVLGLVVAICVAVVVLLSHSGAPASSVSNDAASGVGFSRVNIAAPTFDLPLLQGNGIVTLKKLSGHPIVMNLWASFCDICKEESPAVAQVSRLAGARVRFLGVDSLDKRSAAIRFVDQHKLSFPMVFDPSGVVADKYHVAGLPYTFFISATGTRVLGVNVGALTAKSLISILHKLYGVSVSAGSAARSS